MSRTLEWVVLVANLITLVCITTTIVLMLRLDRERKRRLRRRARDANRWTGSGNTWSDV